MLSKDLLAERYGFNKTLKFQYENFDVEGKSQQEALKVIARKLHVTGGELISFDKAKKQLIFKINVNDIY